MQDPKYLPHTGCAPFIRWCASINSPKSTEEHYLTSRERAPPLLSTSKHTAFALLTGLILHSTQPCLPPAYLRRYPPSFAMLVATPGVPSGRYGPRHGCRIRICLDPNPSRKARESSAHVRPSAFLDAATIQSLGVRRVSRGDYVGFASEGQAASFGVCPGKSDLDSLCIEYISRGNDWQ